MSQNMAIPSMFPLPSGHQLVFVVARNLLVCVCG